ncbi:MAG: peptidoglycan bridge formation glycyltransferase FemA/FemB family protein [Spirochaetes bacterium]|nr:peptidoglycan bridge formation glycyltransferase FemA/FemB family protein [Spirochaetota bacterium]
MEVRVDRREPESLEAAHLLQSGFWCRFKEKFGWNPFAFHVWIRHTTWEGEFNLFLHLRTLFPGFSISYVPFGPAFPERFGKGTSLTEEGGILIEQIGEALRKELPSHCHVVRFDLPWEKPLRVDGDSKLSVRRDLHLYKALLDIQPPDTVILDLTQTEEDLLKGMKPKTRYNVRLAMKKGVVVRQGTEEDLEAWYTLYQETAVRDRIAIHPYSYYRTLFELSHTFTGESPILSLFLAHYEGVLIGGIIVALFKDEALYLYGASSNQHRNVMASYLLQWEAIQWAKSMGARTYDLFGIPPCEDPTHPMVGLYRFKTGFGGRILHRWGSWDYPIHWIVYGIYRQAEQVRTWYYKVFRKRFP